MITGRRYEQRVTASVKDGMWTVNIRGQIWVAKDQGDWLDDGEFDVTVFDKDYDKAYVDALNEAATYILELNEKEIADGQPTISEDNTTS